MDSYRVIVNVEGAIFRDGRYLLVTRAEQESHAPGTLSLVGGKVELFENPNPNDVLENTLRREILEEVTIEIEDEMEYIESVAFFTDSGEPVVDVVFLCKHRSGASAIGDRKEVAGVHWMKPEEIILSSQVPEWTRQSIEKAEKKRIELEW